LCRQARKSHTIECKAEPRLASLSKSVAETRRCRTHDTRQWSNSNIYDLYQGIGQGKQRCADKHAHVGSLATFKQRSARRHPMATETMLQLDTRLSISPCYRTPPSLAQSATDWLNPLQAQSSLSLASRQASPTLLSSTNQMHKEFADP